MGEVPLRGRVRPPRGAFQGRGVTKRNRELDGRRCSLKVAEDSRSPKGKRGRGRGVCHKVLELRLGLMGVAGTLALPSQMLALPTQTLAFPTSRFG